MKTKPKKLPPARPPSKGSLKWFRDFWVEIFSDDSPDADVAVRMVEPGDPEFKPCGNPNCKGCREIRQLRCN